jgi:hypothetical protein
LLISWSQNHSTSYFDLMKFDLLTLSQWKIFVPFYQFKFKKNFREFFNWESTDLNNKKFTFNLKIMSICWTSKLSFDFQKDRTEKFWKKNFVLLWNCFVDTFMSKVSTLQSTQSEFPVKRLVLFKKKKNNNNVVSLTA